MTVAGCKYHKHCGTKQDVGIELKSAECATAPGLAMYMYHSQISQGILRRNVKEAPCNTGNSSINVVNHWPVMRTEPWRGAATP
jgi:hypothetical protein